MATSRSRSLAIFSELEGRGVGGGGQGVKVQSSQQLPLPCLLQRYRRVQKRDTPSWASWSLGRACHESAMQQREKPPHLPSPRLRGRHTMRGPPPIIWGHPTHHKASPKNNVKRLGHDSQALTELGEKERTAELGLCSPSPSLWTALPASPPQWQGTYSRLSDLMSTCTRRARWSTGCLRCLVIRVQLLGQPPRESTDFPRRTGGAVGLGQ